MKNILLSIVAIMVCTGLKANSTTTYENNSHIYRTNATQSFEAQERAFLVQQCQLISNDCMRRYGRNGGRNNSAMNQVIKSEITNYLQNVGTSVAIKLLKEIQERNFDLSRFH